MKKPSDKILKLYKSGPIVGIKIDYRQTGTDTADTFCELEFANGTVIKGKWYNYAKLLDVKIDYCSIARLSDSNRELAIEWFKFEKESRDDIKEYERLQKKLGL